MTNEAFSQLTEQVYRQMIEGPEYKDYLPVAPFLYYLWKNHRPMKFPQDRLPKDLQVILDQEMKHRALSEAIALRRNWLLKRKYKKSWEES